MKNLLGGGVFLLLLVVQNAGDSQVCVMALQTWFAAHPVSSHGITQVIDLALQT